MLVCASCGHENSDGAKFCEECGFSFAAVLAGAKEQRKTVTVLFCDVAGSTQLGERLDPESLRRVMARYFETAKGCLERHGGTVEKFIGDAVMAVFGVPTVHEDDALRALRGAAELRKSVFALNAELERDYGVSLQVRIGVNTGEMVTGTEERLATGDAVNVAARLEQAAQPGEILIGEQTLRLTRPAVEVEPVQPLALKGKAEHVPAYRLVSARGKEDLVRVLDAPMVGRERELDRLRDAFDQAARDRSCHLFTILGPAGVGKSRLAAEFLAGVEGAMVVRGRCLPYGEGITYWPVAEMLKQLPEVELDQLAAAAIRGLLGEEALVTSSEEIAWAVRKLLEAVAAGQPLVCVLDDLHWGEETFLDLVEHVADLSRDAPILLLCMARPDLLDRRSGWGGGKVNATTVLLEPLAPAETDHLIESLAEVDDALRARIREAAEGNPLFVEEMVAMLRESPDGDVTVPPTIQALLAARLDQLDPQERDVLQCGSVEGRVFHRGAVQALTPEEPQVTARLTALVRKELVRLDKAQFPGEDAFRFRHLLIRDAAYDALPKATRAELHDRFGAWLERKAGDRLTEYEEIVAYHLEQAYRYSAELGPVGEKDRDRARRAATLLAGAARRASARGDLRAEANLLERATALLPSDDDVRLELLVELGVVAGSLGDFARASAILTEIAEAAAVKGDLRLQHYALLELTVQRTFTDPTTTYEQLREVNERAIAVFEESGDVAGLARAWSHRGLMHQWVCEWDAEREAMEQALAFAEEAQDDRGARQIRTGLVNALVYGPMPVPRALERLEGLLGDVREHPYSVTYVLAGIAILRAMQGEFDQARRLLAESTSLLTELGLLFRVADAALFSGPVELLAGAPDNAEALLRAGCDVLRAHGETGVFSTLAGYHAEALYRLGRHDDAERATRESEESATLDDADAQTRWRTVRAKIAARRGDIDLALRLNTEAIEYLEGSDYLDLRGDVLLDRAEVLRIAGRVKEARASAIEALRLYEQKGNVVSAERAQAELDQLREGFRGARA